jgi:ATP-dependent Lhr-like helicase
VATERLSLVRAAFSTVTWHPEPVAFGDEAVPSCEEAVHAVVQAWMESTGPTTAGELSNRLSLPADAVHMALLRLESEGQVLRGRFRRITTVRGEALGVRGQTNPAEGSLHGSYSEQEAEFSPHTSHLTPHIDEWCDRRLLARIHRRTLGFLRKEIEPVPAAVFMQFLLHWQHVVPNTRLHAEAGLFEVIQQLEGFEAGASAWERQILPLRIGKYQPELLDRLCLSGAVSWGRLSPPNAPRRVVPSSHAPISLFLREDAEWLLAVFGAPARPNGSREALPLSSPARDVLGHLQRCGASFFADLLRGSGRLASEVEDGLWELVTAGLVTADGFDNLRALLDPRRRRAEGHERSRPRHVAGRWSLLGMQGTRDRAPLANGQAIEPATLTEKVGRQLLRRYGVVFRDLLGRESLDPAWRDLLVQYRRMELRGEIRGGHFVDGFTGEQFALPEAVEALRVVRRSPVSMEIKISAADPLNLAGVILPGPRVPAVSTNFVVLREGLPIRTGQYRETVSGTVSG